MGLRARAWASLRRWVAGWRPAQWTRASEERLPADPAVHALAEAVLARADVASAGAAAQGDMARMMRHFGIDPAEVPPQFSDRLRNAERTCAQCASIGRCQRWSYRQPTKDAPRLFCPNAELFDEIAAGQRQAQNPNDSSKT